MSSDIQKLRRLAQAALVAPDGLSAEWMDRLGQFQESVSPAAIIELLDRLEAADRAWKEVGKSCWDLTEKVIPNIREQLESAEKERDALRALADILRSEISELRAKIAETEKREPVGVMYVGSYYGYELPEWEFDADQCACDRLNEAYVNNPTTLKLYAIPDTKGE